MLVALGESLDQAIAKHPKLTRYITCLPFDLSDARLLKRKSALEKWDAWLKKRVSGAKALGRTIEITRWDASGLKDRLTANAKAGGRIAFWFDKTLLTPEWFQEQFKRSAIALGSRYTAETSLTLPVRGAILATTRDERFGRELGEFQTLLARKDLLFQLIAEGMLSVDRFRGPAAPEEFVRFTFERYGEHMVARGLIERSVTHGDVTAACRSSTPLADMLRSRSSRLPGVLEALAVQLPEGFGGELPDVVRDAGFSLYVDDDFETSLRTRALSAFSERTWALVREIGGASLEFDALVHLATEPRSSYNADTLHERLIALRMPERDASWSIFLANGSEIARQLVEWALTADQKRVEADRARLAGVCLTWFLTTSNRRVRDLSTKALVALLADHPKISIELLAAFSEVDDGYVQERLLAAIYGAALQGGWEMDRLGEVASDVNARVFAGGVPPVNILIRDHARRLIELAHHLSVLPSGFDLKPSQPPYSSVWPIEHVSDSTIATYTRTYASGFKGLDEITSSCVRDGDFARYVLDSAAREWSPALRGTIKLPTRQDLHDQWQTDFLAIADADRKLAYAEFYRALAGAIGKGHPTAEQKKAIETAKRPFEKSLGFEFYERWREEAENWRRYGMYQGVAPRDVAEFNLAWARRWVCWRAHAVGWSEALHGEFDRGTRSDRMAHEVERIGKKYQWLALYELRARMADNLAPLPGGFSDGEPERLRNIDPSLLAGNDPGRETFEDDEAQPVPISDRHFWVQDLVLPHVGVDEALSWLDADDDVPDGVEAVALADPETKRQWLVLTGFDTGRGGPESLHRETFRRVSCVVVDRVSVQTLLELLDGPAGFSHDDLPSGRGIRYRSYLGEHPWLWDDKLDDGWVSDWVPYGAGAAMKGVRVRGTTIGYLAETGAYDYSIETNVDARLPEQRYTRFPRCHR